MKSVVPQIRLNALKLYLKGLKMSLVNDYCYLCDRRTPVPRTLDTPLYGAV